MSDLFISDGSVDDSSASDAAVNGSSASGINDVANTVKNLVAHEIPLKGKHLIEASAGTGKTFNITRLYLRLLLEQKLSVEQILVMTFTKDATEELRGRIDAFIRTAIKDWAVLVEQDPYFIALARIIDAQEAQFLLKRALLFLDDAAIFTIHGFCKRVLSQHAFTSGLSFSAQMVTNGQDLLLEACQDWYRVLAEQSADNFVQLAQFWPEPQSFLSHFSKAISHVGIVGDLETVGVQSLIDSFLVKITAAIGSLEANHSSLNLYLIEVKSGADKQTRIDELAALISWLNGVSTTFDTFKNKMQDAFIDGRRFARAKHKQELVDIFAPVNEVKASVKTLQQQLDKAHAYIIVKQGLLAISEQLVKKKHVQNMLSFDDLISTLSDCLTTIPEGKLSDILFSQYPVALVDEFQDTDPMQFAILKAIYFEQADAALFMIGDPKQAIYGFRGGDVFTYLSARNTCDYQWLMDSNWRSTAMMIQGYNRLFYGNKLDEVSVSVFGYNIPYLPVKPSPLANKKMQLAQDFNALQFVHFDIEQDVGAVKKSAEKAKVKQDFRPVMANWCAAEIVRLLSTGTDDSVAAQPLSGQSLAAPSLAAQDIAILVRDGAEAQAIKQSLQAHGLASVFLSNKANLLHSEQTQQLLAVLKGILHVENERLYTAALASGLLGYNPVTLYQLQQDELGWQQLKFKFSSLRDEWLYKGFISMGLKLMHEHFVIGGDDQDRVLTNLLHLFELLQSASGRHRQPQELLSWLEQQLLQDTPGSEAELRLESDDNLIKIVTQHGSKGLEYPVVFIPFSTRHKDPLRFGNRAVTFIEYHDQQGKLKLSLDGSEQAKQAMAEEAYAETVRLLYVAITRAEQRCYILTTEFDQYANSPLGRTLKWQKDQDMAASLQQLASENPDAIALHRVTELNDEITVFDKQTVSLQSELATFTGKIERDWWLSSFSALSRNLRHGGVSTPDRDNETSLLMSGFSPSSTEIIDSALLRFNLAKGAHTGNLLHDIFEHLDFVQPQWSDALKWPLVKYGELTSGYSEQDLQNWLAQVLKSPLTPCLTDTLSDDKTHFCLGDISWEKSLRESEFYFPMSAANVKDLASLLTQHRADSYSTLNKTRDKSQKAKPVRLPSYKALKGMMHGFIDLIFEHQGKYYLCDYKSSHLGNGYADYDREFLLDNIQDNYYDLQYLIYSLALHRHLAYALPDYDSSQHFGGVYYLYLRGMSQEPNHLGCGVYHRQISNDELTLLDTLFCGENQNMAEGC